MICPNCLEQKRDCECGTEKAAVPARKHIVSMVGDVIEINHADSVTSVMLCEGGKCHINIEVTKETATLRYAIL